MWNLFKPKFNTYIVLRQSPDWATITEKEFEEQSMEFCRLLNRPENSVNEKSQLWNQTFGISFIESRNILKKIAQKNLKKVRNAKIICADEVEDASSGIYIFIDDDDWIQPDIASYFTMQDIDEFDGYRWGSVVFGGGNRELIVKRQIDDTCYTNNYAVSSCYLNSKNLNSVYQHWGAQGNFQRLKIKQFSDYLTITNKHPTSTVFLERNLGNDLSSQNLINIINKYNNKMQLLDVKELAELDWARSYMQQTRSFYQKLLASAKG